jgi:hypothetical protein
MIPTAIHIKLRFSFIYMIYLELCFYLNSKPSCMF